MKFPSASLYECLEVAGAIYLEKPVICHVVVSRIACDDWGVKTTIVDSVMPGMPRLGQRSTEIAAAWEVFSFSAGCWQARYIPWRLFFDPTVVRACIELGAKANQRGSTIDCNDVIEVTLEYDLKEAKTMLGKFSL
jgi:hypothetical protein